MHPIHGPHDPDYDPRGDPEFDPYEYIDEGPPPWDTDEVVANIDEILDANRQAIFRETIKGWAREDDHWGVAAERAHRVAGEARDFLEAGQHAATMVWAATWAELIERDLTLRPIFAGLVKADPLAMETIRELVGRRWFDRPIFSLVAPVPVQPVGVGDAASDRPITAAQDGHAGHERPRLPGGHPAAMPSCPACCPPDPPRICSAG